MGVGVDVDAVGGGVIGHTEINGLPNIPEFYKIISVNLIRLKLDGLAAEIKGLGGGPGGEIVRRRCRGAAQQAAMLSTRRTPIRVSRWPSSYSSPLLNNRPPATTPKQNCKYFPFISDASCQMI